MKDKKLITAENNKSSILIKFINILKMLKYRIFAQDTEAISI